MNNAEKFKQIFGLHAGELWSMRAGDFLAWLNRAAETAQNVQNEDLISRKWLMECIEEGWVKFDTAKDCNRMIHLVRDIAPSVQPEQNAQDGDLISREAAIEALARMMPRSYTPDGSHPADEEIFRAQEVFADCIEALEILPSAQPELTDEQSIAHLQSSGWMQRHDKEMYESGLKEQLADDSDSYDSLLPTVQPEVIRCKDCEHWKNEHLCERLSRFGSFETKADFYCGYAERKTNE